MWEVVDQTAIQNAHKLLERVMEQAVSMTLLTYRTPYQKARVCKQRDALFQLHDLLSQAVQWCNHDSAIAWLDDNYGMPKETAEQFISNLLAILKATPDDEL